MTEAGFVIDGTTYEVPSPSSFDMDEAEIFHQNSGLLVEDIWLDDLKFHDLLKREGFLTALVIIAYRRGNPDVPADQIRARVGKLNRMELFASTVTSLVGVEEDGDEGKDGGATNAPNESSTSSSSENKSSEPTNSGPSGERSTTSSVPQVVAQGTTGTIESGTPSTLPHIRQVV